MPSQHKNAPYRVRLPEAVRERLIRRLQRDQMPVNRYITEAVRERLDRDERSSAMSDSKYLKGIYRLEWEDGSIENHEGYGLPGMMKYAGERGAVKLTDPRGFSHDQVELLMAGWEDVDEDE